MRRRLRQVSQGTPSFERSLQGPFAARHDVVLESTGTCPEDGLSAEALLCPVRTCS
jgi:hypothetical protein